MKNSVVAVMQMEPFGELEYAEVDEEVSPTGVTEHSVLWTRNNPLLRQAFENTDAPVVWELLADSDHATFGVSGGYWWPDLKPHTQERFFEPESSFKLIAPAKAHEMQKEKALALFDLTIRQDALAKDCLLDQSYKADGLTLESRNL